MDHYEPDDKEQHFFASTVFGWGVGDSPMEAAHNALMHSPGQKSLRKGLTKEEVMEAYSGGIWHVPVSRDTHYQINHYMPVVDGITKIYDGPLKIIHKGT